MRFEESIHWPEGLFLHPHHLQQLQFSMEERDRRERSFHMPYPCGLIDFEFDREALQNQRVVIKRISAVMPEGNEVSMPGNTAIPVLDLSDMLKKQHCEPFLVYLALPLRSEHDANLSEQEQGMEKRLFVLHETLAADENSGDNEVPIMRHRTNARLITEMDSKTDMDLLPLMRLIPVYAENMQPQLHYDTDYIPPYLYLTEACPLQSIASELDIQLKKRCNKLLHDLDAAHFSNDSINSVMLAAVLQLQTLNRCGTRIHTMLISGRVTPFELFMELRVLLGDLTALQPLRELQQIEEYNHLDYAQQFMSLIQQIRLLILEEGVSGYSRLEFTKTDSETSLIATLNEHHFQDADTWYLAIQCGEDPRWIISEVEKGDKFKMVNPGGKEMRIRGVKLTELHYPPRFLPALPNALWFTMQINENPRVWENIRKESGILLDWGEGLFRDLEATLFIANLKQEKKA